MEFKIINDCFIEKSNRIELKSMRPTKEIVIEDLQKKFDKQQDKIALINDFMSVFGQRKEIRSDLTDLRNKTKELKNVLATVRDGINTFKTVQVPKTKLLISNMREQNLKILQRMEAMDSTTKMSDNTTEMLSSINENCHQNHINVTSNLTVTTTPKCLPLLPTFNTITPKLYQSPFKVRGDPRLLLQLERQFEGSIKSDQFDTVPKYLKGRDSLDDVSTFLQNVIIKCFMDKYTLLHRDRENVLPNYMQRWQMYRSQMEYFPGEMFITEGDIATLIGRMMDKKMSSRIAMLRHMRIIQEMRKGSATCYIWKGIK